MVHAVLSQNCFSLSLEELDEVPVTTFEHLKVAFRIQASSGLSLYEVHFVNGHKPIVRCASSQFFKLPVHMMNNSLNRLCKGNKMN